MKKVNYHTHTSRCHHAWGTDEEFVLSAIKGGYTELGFSDHSCWKYDSDFVSHIRMTPEEIDGYCESMLALKEKYKDQIKILIGLECEYFPKYMDWLKDFIKEKKLDYVIFGNHYIDSDEINDYNGRVLHDNEKLSRYIDDCIAGMSTGLYSYLCHPDLFMRGRSEFDDFAKKESRRLCEWCKENGVILEYNLEGARMCHLREVSWYPHIEFWKITAEVGNDVIIGIDAHRLESLEDDFYYDNAVKTLTELGMNIVTDLPLRW